MKNLLLAALLPFLAPQIARAQVTCDPVFPVVDDNVTVYFHANEGNAALANFSGTVYAHMGVITDKSSSGSDWKHVTTTWGTADAVGAMTYVSPNLFKKTFNIRAFFSIPASGETVLKLAFVFRNQDGSIVGRAADGSDIFYSVYPANAPLQTIFVKPAQATLLAKIGDQIPVEAAASQTANLTLWDNAQQVTTASGKTLTTTLTVSAAGIHTVAFVAKAAASSDTAFFTYVVANPTVKADPPVGTKPGIQVLDNQTVRLSLFAPNKQVVYVLGDFNDWQVQPNFQMKNSVDGTIWWLDIGGLAPGQPIRFQYFVDGKLKIADPYSHLVLDPWNDSNVPAVTYPNLPAYPAGKTTGEVSVFRTDEPVFNWQSTTYARPKKTDLVIYELLLRDFLARHDYETLLDTLDYFQKLGVNALELMPVNEFGGNSSWGYNDDFHAALDKYYGTKADLQRLVDACHARGIAVVLDVVFNHITGASPLAQLYWDAANNRPAADNPWLNPIPKHEFNVFNDMNHESAATKFYVKNCLNYWQTEFRVDGFRFDLSKGFTQKNTLGDANAMAAYDPTRIAILKDYATSICANDATAYVILEHFADNSEETELAAAGMMLWGNLHFQYKDVALGFQAGFNASLAGISYLSRGWSKPHLVGYMESHDEERIGYECLTYGNSSGGYSVKNQAVALARLEMLANIFYTVPGPKMLWEFGELGYDFSINTCTNGAVNNGCRLDPKPIRWDFMQDKNRRHLHDMVAALIHLRTAEPMFETPFFDVQAPNLGTGRVVKVSGGNLGNAVALANVRLTDGPVTFSFQHSGWWWDYFTGDSILQGPVIEPTNLTLPPSGYRLFLDKKVPLPPGIDLTVSTENLAAPEPLAVAVWPNPASDFLNVELVLETPSPLRLTLLDVTGRVLQVVENEQLGAGIQHLELPLRGLPAGVYFCEIWADGRRTLVRVMHD